MLDEATRVILVSFERESALVVPFGVFVTGYFIFGLNLKKSVSDQFLTSNFFFKTIFSE